MEFTKTRCPVCNNYNNRWVSVDIVVIKDGKVLLGKRRNPPEIGALALPGGYLDWNETLEQAAMRELKEETNLDTIALKLINAYSDPGRHERQTLTLAYLAEVSGEAISGDDLAEISWYSIEELPEKLAFDHRKILQDAITLLKSDGD